VKLIILCRPSGSRTSRFFDNRGSLFQGKWDGQVFSPIRVACGDRAAEHLGEGYATDILERLGPREGAAKGDPHGEQSISSILQGRGCSLSVKKRGGPRGPFHVESVGGRQISRPGRQGTLPHSERKTLLRECPVI